MTHFSLLKPGQAVGWPLAPALATAALLPLSFWLDGPGPAFAGQLTPLWLAALSLGLTLLGLRWLSLPFCLWWLWGALTLAWSLAPGNTLLWTLWTLLYAAAFVAGRWRYGLWLLAGAVAVSYLLKNLSLAAFGSQPFYVSGSNLYVGGAAALPLVAGLLWALGRFPRWWWASVLGLGLSLYAAGISGARSVYLPLLLVGLAALALILWKARPRMLWWMAGLLAALALALVLNAALPGHLIQSALSLKGSVSAQLAATDAGGNLQTRLQLWELNTHMALARPFGTGSGSYAQVMDAFHDWPVYFSRYPHSVYFEQLSAGGWIGLGLLLWTLIQAGLTAWRAGRWAALLAAGALWLHLGFDITSDMPVLMLLAFASLGACLAEEPRVPAVRPTLLWPAAAVVLVGVLAGGWWFWPCQERRCVLTHALGLPAKTLPLLGQQATQGEWRQVKALYPQSRWVDDALLERAVGTPQRVAALKQIIHRYPAASMDYYLQLADLYDTLGQREEGRETLTVGLAVFTRPRSPWGLALQVPQASQHDVEQAKHLLKP